jgi:hypothetical protein
MSATAGICRAGKPGKVADAAWSPYPQPELHQLGDNHQDGRVRSAEKGVQGAHPPIPLGAPQDEENKDASGQDTGRKGAQRVARTHVHGPLLVQPVRALIEGEIEARDGGEAEQEGREGHDEGVGGEGPKVEQVLQQAAARSDRPQGR